MSDTVVFLCGSDELDKERAGYFRAFARTMKVICVPPGDGETWREAVRALRPLLVINPDGNWWLPEGIERLNVATAVFQIDTFAGTRRRVLASAFYDHVFVFHPGLVDAFDHPGVRLLPHAADVSMLSDPARPRHYDVGWVGHRGRSIYRRRDLVLQALSVKFTMNDSTRSYTSDEMASLYAEARVVVNVSRDDWPQDANMRCFEAMAAGALLVTRVPSELTDLGFLEGVHFAGYRDDEDVTEVVARHLADAQTRLAMARRGHDLVARKHTYDARVAMILASVERGARAPARDWPELRAWRRHFEVQVEQGDVRKSLLLFRRIRAHSGPAALAAAPRLVRLTAKVVRRAVRRRPVT